MAKTYISPKDIPQTSSFLKPTLSRTTMQAVYPGDTYEPDPLFKLEWYDPLDTKILNLFKTITIVATHPYTNEPLTTVSFKHYGTSTAWWIILMFNGYLHPDEIPSGAVLNIPDLRAIELALEAKKSRVGQVFIF